MNASNRFGIESLARQHQAEIEKALQQSALLRTERVTPGFSIGRIRRVVAASSLFFVGLLSGIVLAILR